MEKPDKPEDVTIEPLSMSEPMDVQDVASTLAAPFTEPMIFTYKTKAQKQREYRERLAATRTPAEAAAARELKNERQRKNRLRQAMAIASRSLEAKQPITPKTRAQIQRAYRQRIAASKTPEQAAAAREARNVRDRNNRLRQANLLASPLEPHKTTAGQLKLPNDMENYMRYHIIESESHIGMKPGCVPGFEGQSETNKRSRKSKKNNDWEKRDGNERTEDLDGIATDESDTPTNIIHDPIPFAQNIKEILEITVPSVNRDAEGVIIKEEAIDIHEETVEERAADVRVKIERIEDSDSDVIPDTRTQVPEERLGKCMKEEVSAMYVNTENIVQSKHDRTSKEMLEITVPIMNPAGALGVTIKEEPIDMYEEAGETRHTTDISVKIEKYED